MCSTIQFHADIAGGDVSTPSSIYPVGTHEAVSLQTSRDDRQLDSLSRAFQTVKRSIQGVQQFFHKKNPYTLALCTPAVILSIHAAG